MVSCERELGSVIPCLPKEEGVLVAMLQVRHSQMRNEQCSLDIAASLRVIYKVNWRQCYSFL